MEGQRYDHRQEEEAYDPERSAYDPENINSVTEIVKMRRHLIVNLISAGEITNPEAAIIAMEKLQRARDETEKELHQKAKQETGKEIYATAREYARRNAIYERYLVGEPPSPVRYCIEEAQERIRNGFFRGGYDLIKQDDELFADSQKAKEFIEGNQEFNPDLADQLKRELKQGRAYGIGRLEAAAREYRAAANWYAMAAKLERMQEAKPAAPPPKPDH